jgi:hypothetical protein
MTPKEKAIKIFDAHMGFKMNPYNDIEMTLEKGKAKEHALIAVDEVQQLIKDLSSCNYRFIYIIDEMNFWQEVKQEIEKL